jgi:hypothetical protein
MTKTNLFDPKKIYIIRADKAGVFMAKIESIDTDGTAVCNSLRRLYYWEGALDVTQIAAHGVLRPGSCKFSVQMGEKDKSTLFNLIEFHPASQKAIDSINSVREWTK